MYLCQSPLSSSSSRNGISRLLHRTISSSFLAIIFLFLCYFAFNNMFVLQNFAFPKTSFLLNFYINSISTSQRTQHILFIHISLKILFRKWSAVTARIMNTWKQSVIKCRSFSTQDGWTNSALSVLNVLFSVATTSWVQALLEKLRVSWPVKVSSSFVEPQSFITVFTGASYATAPFETGKFAPQPRSFYFYSLK
jgi:hypothetical protein